MTFDAVIVAGGKGSRMGYVSKADLVVSGRRLLDTVLEAAKDARTKVVVGDTQVPDGVILTREDPPGTGPAAGLVAGLEVISEPASWVLVLACDLPDAPRAVGELLRALPDAPGDVDGLSLQDAGGELQPLAAVYRAEALRSAVEAYGNPENRSVRRMIAPLRLQAVDPGEASVQDLDTPEQLAQWVARQPRAQEDETPAWRAFIEDVCGRLDLPSDLVDESAVLDQSRTVARSGARPMAPVAPYIWGLAMGQAAASGADVDPAHLLEAINDAIESAPLPEE